MKFNRMCNRTGQAEEPLQTPNNPTKQQIICPGCNQISLGLKNRYIDIFPFYRNKYQSGYNPPGEMEAYRSYNHDIGAAHVSTEPWL